MIVKKIQIKILQEHTIRIGLVNVIARRALLESAVTNVKKGTTNTKDVKLVNVIQLELLIGKMMVHVNVKQDFLDLLARFVTQTMCWSMKNV